MPLNKILLPFLCLATFSSCDFRLDGNSSVLSANVHVVVAPYGEGSVKISSQPVILLTGGEKVCRPRPFVNSEAVTVLKEESLTENFLEDLFGEEGGGEGGAEVRADSSRNEPVKTSVGDNWLEFGLWISNANKGRNSYFLIIRNIIWVASANYRRETLSASGNVDAGYCEGPPFLYLVPPNRKVTYSPESSNPLHNLTIFLDGFNIIDRSGEPSPLLGVRASETGGVRYSYSPNEIIVIPSYTVQLTLRGYFLTKSGVQVAPFVKRVYFRTGKSL